MDFKAILNNKPMLFGIIGGVVLVIVLIVVIIISSSNSSGIEKEPVITTPAKLLTVPSQGQALEIMSLLASKGVKDVESSVDGSKITISLTKYRMSDKDRAILAIVRSGLMDKNIGLEIFDKSDFTASKDDKKIRLARAMNGELSRLIKKIEGISDASVFISMQEDTIFEINKKPITATVQITMLSASGNTDDLASLPDKLPKEKVRAITNLLLGSVTGLDSQNITITDTNGNVYTSIINAEEDMMSLIEEKDSYMKRKVTEQLNRLLGKGNFTVTVSTYLRESPLETNELAYNPKKSAVLNKQRFLEGLGDNSSDRNKFSSAVSTYIPGSLPSSPESASNRRYSRTAEEFGYAAGKTVTSELKKPGMTEDISIAVTITKGAMPADLSQESLKTLVARAANPKAKPESVEIAFDESSNPGLTSERPEILPKAETSGNPWWTLPVLLGLGLIAGLIFIGNKVKNAAQKHQKDIETLIEKTQAQEHQIREAQERSVMLQNKQDEINHTLTTAKQAPPSITTLKDTIKSIKDDIDDELDEEEFATSLKSWIETN